MSRTILWAIFLAGWMLHALLQAKASVSSKSNGLRSIREWFALTWQFVFARWFLSALALQLWMEAPAVFGATLGISALPLTKATAGIFGYSVDSLLDKLGASFGLKIEIPKLAPPREREGEGLAREARLSSEPVRIRPIHRALSRVAIGQRKPAQS